MRIISFILVSIFFFQSCQTPEQVVQEAPKEKTSFSFDWSKSPSDGVDSLLHKYTPFTLKASLDGYTNNEKLMIKKLIEAGEIMNELFWKESYGDKAELMENITDERIKTFAEINYGPWDRLNNNAVFVDGQKEKNAGANYYPADMTKEEFEAADLDDRTSLYTMIRRNDKGELVSIPYHQFFEKEVNAVSKLLAEASELTENTALKKYLSLRSIAMLNDEYQKSDFAWLDMKDNNIDVVIGPIENYEDQLFGYKTAHECYVLLKDMEWSKRLAKYAQYLPGLQKGLPVDEAYKSENPGRDTELNAYEVIYYAGDCNAGSKTIAINLPNDEEVQLEKGTRRLQLKNAMQAKFEKILLPIANELITPDQRDYITFDAFFSNTMFHEVAHGLGIKKTIDGKGTVREALKEHHSALEEGKADMLGLYMIKQLHDEKKLEGDLKAYYVTFMTSIFRSIRFGASSAHGKANMIRFNYFKEFGAFSRDEKTGHYTVDFEKLEDAMYSLANLILTLQGDGDYDAVAKLVETKAKIGETLQSDLDMLAAKGIPVDVVFNQGVDVLGL